MVIYSYVWVFTNLELRNYEHLKIYCIMRKSNTYYYYYNDYALNT